MKDYCLISGCYEDGRWLVIGANIKKPACSSHIADAIECLGGERGPLPLVTVIDLKD